MLLKLPPSAAGVWVNCPASPEMIAKFPRPPSDERSEKQSEGLAFHELSEIMLMSGTVELPEFIDTMSSFGIVYDREMYEAAQLYAGDVFETCAPQRDDKHDHPVEYHVEKRADLSHIADEMHGYVDCSAFSVGARTLTVWEAKYGHKIVDVFENWQSILYVDAITERMGIDGYHDQHTNVCIKLVQPRAYHRDGPIREWCFKLSDLRAYVNKLRDAATEARSGSPMCRTGSHCGSCDASHACEALQASTYSLIDHLSDTSGVPVTGADLSLEYSKLLKLERLFKARMSGLEAQLLAEVQNGVEGHTFTGEMGYGRLSWTADRSEVLALAEMYGVTATKESESPLITPTQLIKKGIDATVISEYSAKPMTGIKLVEQTAASMRRIFTKKGS